MENRNSLIEDKKTDSSIQLTCANNMVFWYGKDQEIYQLYYQSGWYNNDIGTFAPKVSAGTPLACVVNQVYFIDINGHIGQLIWDGSKWNCNNLTLEAKGSSQALTGGSISFVENQVYFITKTLSVGQLYWNGSSWSFNLIGPKASAPSASSSDPVCCTNNATYYLSYSDRHVIQLIFDSGKWSSNDLTEAAKKTGEVLNPAEESPLVCLVNSV